MRVKSVGIIRSILDERLLNIGKCVCAPEVWDAACIAGPLFPGVERALRDAVENGKGDKNKKVAVVLQTGGGSAEVTERMVGIIRHHYEEVAFIIPDMAMSAGTMLAMSGDRILMDYYSCLGPIDSQVEIDNGAALSVADYLRKFEEMRQKSKDNELTKADAILLRDMDIGELERYKKEQELGVELVAEWLSRYKFKNWKITRTKKKKVTPQMRRARARQIAKKLNDNDRWHTHGRPIGMDTLRELKLQVDDCAENKKLDGHVKDYFSLLQDYMAREKISGLVQLGGYFAQSR